MWTYSLLLCHVHESECDIAPLFWPHIYIILHSCMPWINGVLTYPTKRPTMGVILSQTENWPHKRRLCRSTITSHIHVHEIIGILWRSTDCKSLVRIWFMQIRG
jgi:hypothetical protein